MALDVTLIPSQDNIEIDVPISILVYPCNGQDVQLYSGTADWVDYFLSGENGVDWTVEGFETVNTTNPYKDQVNVQFHNPGTYKLNYLLNDGNILASNTITLTVPGPVPNTGLCSGPDVKPPGDVQVEQFSVKVEECTPIIGTVTMSGPATKCKDSSGTYTANNTGNAPDIFYQWTTTDNLATIASPSSSTTQVTFRTKSYQTLTCKLTSATASDSPETISKVVTVDDCTVDPCDGVTCGPNEYCDNGVCKPIDPCQGVTCSPGEVCVNGICEPDPTYDPCKGIVCKGGEYCDNGVCVPIPDPCDGVVCPPGEECQSGTCVPVGTPDPCDGAICPPGQICQDGKCVDYPPAQPSGSDEFHYRYPNQYFTSRQDTLITTRDTEELNDYEKGIGRTTNIDRTLDKKIILPPDLNP